MLAFFPSVYRSVFRDKQAVRFLGAVFCFGAASGMFGGVLNNYLHDILAIDRVGRGLVEMPRELPGLLLFLLLAVLYRVSESRILRIAMLAGIVGLVGLVAVGTTRWAAVLLVVAWSTGEHLMQPLRPSISVHLAREGREGAAMGSTDGIGNIGGLIGQYLVPLVFMIVPALAAGRSSSFLPYRVTFVLGTVALVVGLVVSGALGDNKPIRRDRLSFNRKYIRYYILEVFFGARKQIFLTFAPYVLILSYGAGTALLSSLYGIVSLVNIFLSPTLGRVMDRIGYKAILIADGLVLTVLCFFYGFSHRMFPHGVAFVVVSVVFVLDSIMFITGMARSMYVKAASTSQEEVTSTLSTGISVNHLVSIVIAMVGGLLWERLGMEVLFSAAGVFTLGYFAFALALPVIGKARAAATK
jgi:hypothetical protein